MRWFVFLWAVFCLGLMLCACGDEPAPAEVPDWAHVAPGQIGAAEEHDVPVAFENDLGMRFVLIPAGTFLMGSPEEDYPETPQHEVTLTKPYYMQITELTNAQYRRFKPGHVSGTYEVRSFNGDRQPVVMVNWADATAFAKWVSRRDAARGYRLPTEAEWEYACRAGTTTRYWSGDTEEGLARVAWYSGTGDFTDAVTNPVGEKPANPWGLHDMHGNVCEHCQDWYCEYGTARVQDPQGPSRPVPGQRWLESGRVFRGGCLHDGSWGLRSAWRAGPTGDVRGGNCGFRLVSPLPEKVEQPTASPLWPDAVEAIARSEKYGGLRIVEQEGLSPLGPDPVSGLYEFAVERTGTMPKRSATRKRLLLTDDFAIVLVLIPGGTFWMGAQTEDPEKPNHDWQALDDESPVHEVTLPPFFLAKHEATQAQWVALGGGDRSVFGWSDRLPVDSVSWGDCREILGSRELRLPAEAEWEYACRAGTTTPYWAGASEGALARVDWYWQESCGETHPVGEKPSNAYGLHDMHGNVLELCEDGYHRYYEGAPTDGSAWVEGGTGDRVSRGGSLATRASDARSAYRSWIAPGARDDCMGFRPARTVTAK